MRESSDTILLIHPGGFGDILLAVPAMGLLRRHYPQHEIGLLASSEVGRLLQVSGAVDRLFPIEGGYLTGLMSGLDGHSEMLARWLARCTIVVGWLHDREGRLRTALQAQGVGQIVLQSLAGAAECHQSDRVLLSLRELGISEEAVSSVLMLPDSLVHEGRAQLTQARVAPNARVLVCHLGSGSRHKCVAPPLWAELLRECLRLQWTPVVVVGPADEWVLESDVWRSCESIPIFRPDSVTQLAGLLANAQGYLGHDTGVTHLAAMLGVPTIAMFGPTDPQQWAPRGAHVTVIRGGSCECQGWDAVQACTEKPCLSVKRTDVAAVLQRIASRYHRVTNS